MEAGNVNSSSSSTDGTNILVSIELPAEGEREAVQLHLLDPFSAMLKDMPNSFHIQLSKALPDKPHPAVGGSSDSKPAGKRRKLDGVRPDPWTALAAPASAALRKAWLPADGKHREWWIPTHRTNIVHWETEEWTSAPWLKQEVHLESIEAIKDEVLLNFPHFVREDNEPVIWGQGRNTGRILMGSWLVHTLVTNPSDAAVAMLVDVERVLFNPSVKQKAKRPKSVTKQIHCPARAGWLITNLLRSQTELPRGWQRLLDFATDHPPSLLLLDPPYPNRSATRLHESGEGSSTDVERAEGYAPVTDIYDLWALKEPVKTLLERSTPRADGDKSSRGALVGCWVTNDPKAQHFVLEKLFPAWDVQSIGEIAWLKTTASNDGLGSEPATIGGEPCITVEPGAKSPRKPCELLLLGRHGMREGEVEEIKNTMIVSVPIGHSRKPYVLDVLKHLLPAGPPNVFELFARNLMAGPETEAGKGTWISVGNEAPKFNTFAHSYIKR